MRLLAAVLLLGVAATAWGAGSVLERVEVLADRGPAVRLHLSAPAAATARTLPAEGDAPARIYIDLADTARGPLTPSVLRGVGPLLRVRTGQFDPTTTRVVLDLADGVPFAVHPVARTVIVELTAREPMAPTTTAAGPAPRPVPERGSGVPIVVLDAGHGGRDPGAAGVGGVLEKDVVLEVARLLASRLPGRLPVNVLMTRSDDSFLPIERRLAASGGRALLFLSLHANACPDPRTRGLEVFYGGGALRTASTPGAGPRAALLGRCVDEALRARVGPVRGPARPGTFRVLVHNPVPSALVEIGYLTHPGDAVRAQDVRYRELLADALMDGVAAFLRATAPPL